MLDQSLCLISHIVTAPFQISLHQSQGPDGLFSEWVIQNDLGWEELLDIIWLCPWLKTESTLKSEQVAQGLRSSFVYLQCRTFPTSLGTFFSAEPCSWWNIFPCIFLECYLCLFTIHLRREGLHLLCALPLVRCRLVSPEMFILQAEQTQLIQLLLLQCVLQTLTPFMAICGTRCGLSMSALSLGARNWAQFCRCGCTGAEQRRRFTPLTCWLHLC